VVLHSVGTLGLVECNVLRIQAMLLPIQDGCVSGHDAFIRFRGK